MDEVRVDPRVQNKEWVESLLPGLQDFVEMGYLVRITPKAVKFDKTRPTRYNPVSSGPGEGRSP